MTTTRRSAIARRLLGLVAFFICGLGALCAAGESRPERDGPCHLRFYGTYSLGTKHASSFRDRATELRSLGGNLVVALAGSRRALQELPPGLLAAPGCSLVKPAVWNDEKAARQRLGEIAAEFAGDPRVFGVCLSHEVDEFADHDRRVRMYRLARPFFPGQRVFFYYARVPADYGLRGEVESDVLLYELNPFNRSGDFDLAKLAKKLERGLAVIDRTPGIPLWAQTSVNADHKYVTGPETMIRTWGATGENMIVHAEKVFSRTSPAGVGLSGLFWRSLGRFDWDLGHPDFAAHRRRLREIGERSRCG